MPADDNDLGPWEDERAAITHAPLDGAGLYSNHPAWLQFKHVAMNRAAAELPNLSSHDGRGVFVLGNPDLFSAARPRSRDIYALRNGRESVSGQLIITNKTLAHGLAIQSADVGQLPFETVVETLSHFGADDQPTVLVDPYGDPRIYFYPSGLAHPFEAEDWSPYDRSVSLTQIDRALNGLYAYICTPDQVTAGFLWDPRGQCIPARRTESVIQDKVQASLAASFWYLQIRAEQPTSVGRTDVEMIDVDRPTAGENIRHALLELKVLRSYTASGRTVSDNVNRRNIREGIRQASQYGQYNNSRIKMLCCYDMTRVDYGDSPWFSPHSNYAHMRYVELRRYFLYNTSRGLRDAREDG